MTVLALSNALKSILSRAGVENPDGDTLEILNAVAGYTRIDLITRRDEGGHPRGRLGYCQ